MALYAMDSWANDYFAIDTNGQVTVQLKNAQDEFEEVSLITILEGLHDRGLHWPVLLRFGDLLHHRLQLLHSAFDKAIGDLNYQGSYRGVYPIKVNQQEQTLDYVTQFGRPHHFGLETGTKSELIAALAYLNDTDAYLICNGYKDEDFIDLALRGQKMGLQVILVIEMPSELDTILKRAEVLNVRPILGIRMRLATKSNGHWAHSAGHKSVFGLHASQVTEVVDRLRETDSLDCLRMLHFHQGSQIPNIRAIRQATMEATRIYADLIKEGAPMGLLDLGGGLAVDYDGSKTSGKSSSNYDIREYCEDLVDVIMRVCDENDVAHPDIITESGRAVVSYFSVLVFNVLGANTFLPGGEPEPMPSGAPDVIKDLYGVLDQLEDGKLQECFNDALFYRDQLTQLYIHGSITLRDRSLGEQVFSHLMKRMTLEIEKLEHIPVEMAELEELGVDFYYGNFSLFQSLPDSWAIGQIFPVVPLHRHTEAPTRHAVIADITCDCDGRLDRFIGQHMIRHSLPVHELRENEDYLLGVFSIGAYQETLGDLHNLIGDTNIVSVKLGANGRVIYEHEVSGDSVGDVLSFVEYDLAELRRRFRSFAEEAVTQKRISAKERREFTDAYEAGLRGYTYFGKKPYDSEDETGDE